MTVTLEQTPHAPEVLAAGAKLLDDLGVRWWLSAGTALGIHRDGELIPWDTDLDVGVLADGTDVLARIDTAFAPAGFRSVRRTGFQAAFRLRDVIFDVYLFRREGDSVVSDTDVGRMTKPARLIDGLGMVEFAGRSYPIPSPTDEYLLIRYGPGWRTPRRSKRPWQYDAANLA